MKVLVYGAGVIGSYLTHTLCQAGNEVSLVARGRWKEVLEVSGLVLHHHLQQYTTADHPEILEKPGDAHYDAVFVVMQQQQRQAILGELAEINTPLIVLVGNNMSAPEMEREILSRSAAPKTVLFGFQGTAGNREDSYVECVRWNGGEMTVGGVHRGLTDEEKTLLTELFSGTKYRLIWEEDMDGWYKCHLALILPVAYLCYMTGCNLKKATRSQRRQLLDAANEGFGLLSRLGVAIRPAGEDSYYCPGGKRVLSAAMMFAIEKTALGKLCASDHCRHAVSEMEALDTAWSRLREQAPDFPMPAWDAMRSAMPGWDALHQSYDGR
jgi:2-dehydropantoate 2-reductase